MPKIDTVKVDNPDALLAKARIHDGVAYVSGQAPLDMKTKKPTSDDIAEQIRETFRRIDAILEEAGTSKANLLKVQVYLTDVKKDFGTMNQIYREWLSDVTRPARTTVEAQLAIEGLKVEVDCVAAVE